ncbi:Ig-like domain-containing protein [Sciscionella marina]|uniref:Ig-like domain-containing protein n=1 Tax=Sciscionella marina TaxID=508770 RepID=UPI0003772931|nr:Ig-like domain-containing protein [Sciscionella marina]
MRLRKILAGILGAGLVSGLTLVATPQLASAAGIDEGAGMSVGPTPGGNPAGTWLGQYVVGGKKVFCVDYALPAPGSDQPYKPGDALKTKWGTAIPKSQASDISYLLLKYGNTKDNLTAAAVAHLLHSWTAPVVKGHPGDPHDPIFKGHDTKWIQQNLAYDSGYYASKMNASLKQKVAEVKKDAAANRAPWDLQLTPPEQPQINKPGTWTLKLTSGAKNPVSDVPISLTSSQATIDGAKSTKVTTDANGTAQVKVTPTGAKPTLQASLNSPNALPRVQEPLNNPNVQKVVLGGGEQNLSKTFEIQGGGVKVTKTDSESGKGISGVSLRITGGDKKSPAQTFDGKELLGADKQPAVVQTGDNGLASVGDLAAPQQICVIETAPAKDYDQSYDAKNPPSACGTIQPGKTLALSLSNKKNKAIIPVVIPAGGSSPTVTAASATSTLPSSYGLLGFGGGIVVLAGVGGVLLTRKLRRR